MRLDLGSSGLYRRSRWLNYTDEKAKSGHESVAVWKLLLRHVLFTTECAQIPNQTNTRSFTHTFIRLPYPRLLGPCKHGLTIRRPARLIELNPSILRILPPCKPVIRALRQPSPWRFAEGTGKGLSDFAEGVGEQDVGDWEIGAEDAAERFEDGHDSQGDTNP